MRCAKPAYDCSRQAESLSASLLKRPALQVAETCRKNGAADVEVYPTDLADGKAVDKLAAQLLEAHKVRRCRLDQCTCGRAVGLRKVTAHSQNGWRNDDFARVSRKCAAPAGDHCFG